MASKRLPRSVYAAINRAVTPEFGKWAKKNYGIGGKRLLAKVAAVEGGGTSRKPNVSYAGARGPFQFIKSTRDAYVKQYGVDPWKDDVSAAKAAMIHLKGTGIRGYNPGLGAYESMVLGAKVDTEPLKTGRYGSGKVKRGRRSSLELKSKTIPGVDNSALRDQLKLNYLSERDKPDALLNLAMGLSDAKDVAPTTETRVVRKKGSAARGTALKGTRIRRDGWKGARSAGAPLARIGLNQGLQSVSEKRDTVSTASGGVSDHYRGNKEAYAWDLSNGSSPTPQMDKAARRIVRQLGGRYDGKSELVFNKTKKINGRTYRFQVLYRTQVGGNHNDHIHVGVRRLS